MTTPTCQRCGTELPSGYTTRRLSAVEQELLCGPDGTGMATMLAAVSACSWGCLTVLAAQRAVADGTADAATMMVAERERQVTTEQWRPEHDDQHPPGQLVAAAVCYATPHAAGIPEDARKVPAAWPWDAEWWKPKDQLRDLVRAGALLAAEVDRELRAARSGGVRF